MFSCLRVFDCPKILKCLLLTDTLYTSGLDAIQGGDTIQWRNGHYTRWDGHYTMGGTDTIKEGWGRTLYREGGRTLHKGRLRHYKGRGDRHFKTVNIFC